MAWDCFKPKRIDADIVSTAAAMLAAGSSQRNVARMLGISRSTVSGIESGKIRAADRAAPRGVSKRFGRCPTCGAKCWLPCYGCAVARYAQTGDPPEFIPPLDPHGNG